MRKENTSEAFSGLQPDSTRFRIRPPARKSKDRLIRCAKDLGIDVLVFRYPDGKWSPKDTSDYGADFIERFCDGTGVFSHDDFPQFKQSAEDRRCFIQVVEREVEKKRSDSKVRKGQTIE